MKKKSIFTFATLTALCGGLVAAPTDRAVEKFKTHAESQSEWNETAKLALEEAEGPARITAALRLMHPDFAKAVEAVTGTPLDKDMEPLKAFAEGEDPWLAAEASYYLARALGNLGRHEDAVPLMQAINEKFADTSARIPESHFYQGISLMNLLRRDDAADALNTFIDDYPKAPTRLRDQAMEAISTLESIEEGSIGDVADHMGLSGRRLGLEDSGKPTQSVQKKIVDMLEKLIEEAEKREKEQQQQQQQQPGGSSSQSQGGNPGNSESNQQGGNPNAQQPPKSLRRVRGAAKSAWDDLRERKRTAEALSALKSQYPPRYQALIEQYFRDLQESSEEESPE